MKYHTRDFSIILFVAKLIVPAACFVVVTVLTSVPVMAKDDQEQESQTRHSLETGSFGFSYPMIFSFCGGTMFPLGRETNSSGFPTVVSLRTDVTLGLGGGGLDAGVTIPIGGGAINLKASTLRTWLVKWREPLHRTYNGGIVEFVVFGHIPAKLGFGYFKDRDEIARRRNTFRYVFVGYGF